MTIETSRQFADYSHDDREDNRIYCRDCHHVWVDADPDGSRVDCPECGATTSTHEPRWDKKAKILHGNSCKVCGSVEGIHVHHVDGDHSNNDGDNLMPLCDTCHEKIHHGNPENVMLAALQAKMELHEPDYPHAEGDRVVLAETHYAHRDELKEREGSAGVVRNVRSGGKCLVEFEDGYEHWIAAKWLESEASTPEPDP